MDWNLITKVRVRGSCVFQAWILTFIRIHQFYIIPHKTFSLSSNGYNTACFYFVHGKAELFIQIF